MSIDFIVDAIRNSIILAGAPLLFGTLGETLTEKSGNLNLGVEGMMFMGAIAGLAGPFLYEQAAGAATSGFMAAILALLCAFLCGSLGALIYSFLTVTLRANQNVTGLTLTIFGIGFANFFGESLGNSAGGYAAVGPAVKAAFSDMPIPLLSDIPVLGRLLFSYNFLVYLGVAIAIVLAWFLNRTRIGLNLRAVGESPATADAAGISIVRYKYIATLVGGGICGIGGMYISMIIGNGVWVHNIVNGMGWISVALVIFASWSPLRALFGALLFGALTVMRMYVSLGIPNDIYNMFPYIATVLVLVFTSIRQTKEGTQPKSCGINYFREER